MATYTFGCAKVAGKNDWLVQSANKNNSAQEATALDEAGEPAAVHFYQKVSELSFEAVIPDSESSIPEIGDVFTYDGVKYYVTGVTESRVNTDFIKYSLTVKRYTSAGLPSNL